MAIGQWCVIRFKCIWLTTTTTWLTQTASQQMKSWTAEHCHARLLIFPLNFHCPFNSIYYPGVLSMYVSVRLVSYSSSLSQTMCPLIQLHNRWLKIEAEHLFPQSANERFIEGEMEIEIDRQREREREREREKYNHHSEWTLQCSVYVNIVSIVAMQTVYSLNWTGQTNKTKHYRPSWAMCYVATLEPIQIKLRSYIYIYRYIGNTWLACLLLRFMITC